MPEKIEKSNQMCEKKSQDGSLINSGRKRNLCSNPPFSGRNEICSAEVFGANCEMKLGNLGGENGESFVLIGFIYSPPFPLIHLQSLGFPPPKRSSKRVARVT